MTVMSEGLASKFKIYYKGSRGGRFSSFPQRATSCNCLPCGLTVIHLQLRDLKKSLGDRRFGVASEFCDSRRWLKFKLDDSPLFSSAKLKMTIAAVKVIWV